MFKSKSLSTKLALMTTAVLSLCCVILVWCINYSISVKLENFSLLTDENIEISFSTDQLLRTMKIEGFFYLVIAILAGGFVTWVLVHRLLKPIQELSSHMRETTSSTLSHTVPVGKHSDEITELVTSFNDMSRQLDEAFAMQKRFSAHAAHELRTPLAVIQTKLEVFSMKNRSEEEYRALFEVIKTQTERLSSLVKSLLELTEINDLPMEDSVFLKEVLNEAVTDLKPVAEKKEISLLLKEPEEPLFVTGNHLLLYRVFYNLTENAIRYNHNSGQVTITVWEEPDKIGVAVADTGEGIPEENKTHIFEPFYRVDKSRSRALGGAGIGLSFVHDILKRHNALILVKDRDGGGTVFEIRFPKTNG